MSLILIFIIITLRPRLRPFKFIKQNKWIPFDFQFIQSCGLNSMDGMIVLDRTCLIVSCIWYIIYFVDYFICYFIVIVSIFLLFRVFFHYFLRILFIGKLKKTRNFCKKDFYYTNISINSQLWQSDEKNNAIFIVFSTVLDFSNDCHLHIMMIQMQKKVQYKW